MTEKQFTDIEVGADTGRVRLYNGINFMEYSSSELLDLLNEQYEQINTLCESRRELISANNEYRMRETELAQELSGLVDENEQLKQVINEMRDRGLNVLNFYEDKLKNAKNENFQEVRDELWIVKLLLYEMGFIDD